MSTNRAYHAALRRGNGPELIKDPPHPALPSVSQTQPRTGRARWAGSLRGGAAGGEGRNTSLERPIQRPMPRRNRARYGADTGPSRPAFPDCLIGPVPLDFAPLAGMDG